jgi:hypothetical protein
MQQVKRRFRISDFPFRIFLLGDKTSINDMLKYWMLAYLKEIYFNSLFN